MKFQGLWVWTLFLSASLSGANVVENYLVEADQINHFSGIYFIDCVYVINLQRRFDKWENVNDQLNKYSIYPTRFNAIDGWKLSKQDVDLLIGSYPMRMRVGQICCLLSHLSVIKSAYDRGFQCIWVCEDDIDIVEDPHQLSFILLNLYCIDFYWDILYTDIDTKGNNGIRVQSLMSDFRPDQENEPIEYYRQRIRINDDISEIKQRFGAYSMIISRNGMEKILRYFTSLYLWTAYDIDIHYIPNIKQYSMNRDIVTINYLLPSDT